MILAAPPDERLIEGSQPLILADRRRSTLILALCFLLHAIPIAFLIHQGVPDNLAPAEQEIPVEVIVEPPPPKEPEPAPPKNEQKAEQTPFDEKPATDAPRAPNEEKVERDSKDKESHAPEANPEPKPAEMKPLIEPARTAEKKSDYENAEPSAPKLKDDRPDGEPINAADSQRPDMPEQTKAEQAAPKPVKQQTAAQQPTTAFAATPDYSFAPASKYSPVTGGNAAATYLSILYGMVGSHMHRPDIAPRHAHTMGEIAFDVDFGGSLIRARVLKSSGIPELDAAALAAIRAAAPFPLPPTGNGLSLRLHYKGD
jgi:TonB family protein